MSLGVLNNISAIYAQTNLNQTQASLQNTLTQLSSGSRINSGADDAAGLALADGLHANVAALTQSSQNASAGVGLLQTADGALSQVTNLLNRAVTLATEAANGTLNTNQVSSSVGTTSAGAGADLTTNATLSATTAQAILTTLTSAVQDVAYQRGTIGANINQLNAASNVASSQSVNLSAAENNIRATNFGQATSDMAKYKVLSQTGIAALSQANAVQQDVLKLLQ